MQKSNTFRDFDELKQKKYGESNSPQSLDFQARAKTFQLGMKIKHIRKKKKITQEELANRIGTKKSYISKIEKGSDLKVSTLIKIFDQGLETPIHFLLGEVVGESFE